MVLRDRQAELRAVRNGNPYGKRNQLKYPLLPTDYMMGGTPGAPKPRFDDHERKPGVEMPPRVIRPKHAVYRFYNGTDQLLYVGYSTNPYTRYENHRKSHRNPWWHLVHHTGDLLLFSNENAAKIVELEIMRDERPLYNKDGNRIN